jgi:DNA-binding PadR family transcriptional regulator
VQISFQVAYFTLNCALKVSPKNFLKGKYIMANDLLKKDYVKTIIHLFLLEIERKKFNNIPLSQDELRWISNKQNLLYYVYEQKTHPVYTTDQNVAREDKKSTIGESTIYNAIREMEDDGIIECKNRQFQEPHTKKWYNMRQAGLTMMGACLEWSLPRGPLSEIPILSFVWALFTK